MPAPRALGTEYAQIARKVQALIAEPAMQTVVDRDEWHSIGPGGGRIRRFTDEPSYVRKPPTLVVDANGVGRAVPELLRQRGLKPVAIAITGGAEVTHGDTLRVPKRELVGSLQVALQAGRLKIAAELPLRPVLVEELRNFRVKVNPLTAHDSWNAREGQHDDIVLAVAVALWHAEREARRSRQNAGSWPVIQY
ncbi:MAG: hypothetical protein ACR2OG_03920 [Gemmatimonadaceae bacterium]